MNTKYGEVTFVDDRDGLTVQSSARGFVLSCDTGPVRASIVYTRDEAEALCRDLAQRLNLFIAGDVK